MKNLQDMDVNALPEKIEKVEKNIEVEAVESHSYCSRLHGDRICRCGSNFKGRYCTWSYLPDRFN